MRKLENTIIRRAFSFNHSSTNRQLNCLTAVRGVNIFEHLDFVDMTHLSDEYLFNRFSIVLFSEIYIAIYYDGNLSIKIVFIWFIRILNTKNNFKKCNKIFVISELVFLVPCCFGAENRYRKNPVKKAIKCFKNEIEFGIFEFTSC